MTQRQSVAQKSEDQLLEYPFPDPARHCVVIPGFLSRAECQRHIALSESRGFVGADTDYPPSYRNNDRQVLDDPTLARVMLERLRSYVPDTLVVDHADTGAQAWSLMAINPRFRFCRYAPGQQFRIHQDGVHHVGKGVQSRLTFMIYLTDGDDFEGGDTLFYAAGPDRDVPAQVMARVRPRAGSLILFDHTLWHAGAEVTAGIKHIMRSDVIYRLDSPVSPDKGPFQPSHDGYVWTLAQLGSGRLASGGRDGIIRLWTDDGLALGVLQGHTQSVLGLAMLDSQRLASVSRDRSLRLWNIDSGFCEHHIVAHEAAVLTVASLNDGTVATGSADGLIRCWNASAELILTMRSTGWIWDIAPLLADEMASASESGEISLWDCRTGALRDRLGAGPPLRALAATPDGHQLFSGNNEGDIVGWSRVDGQWKQQRLWSAHHAAIRRLRFIAADVLASTGEDAYVRLWNIRSGELLQAFAHDNFVTDVLATSAHVAVSCAYDGVIRTHSLSVESADDR